MHYFLFTAAFFNVSIVFNCQTGEQSIMFSTVKLTQVIREAVLVIFAWGIGMWFVFVHAEVEAQMGMVQKIFYLHVPAAYSMYTCWLICTVYSILFLSTRKTHYDTIAKSAAHVALLFALMVMISGPLWGRKSWGVFWVWDPRLTSALLLSLIILSYVMLRRLKSTQAIQKMSAAIAVLGSAMIPFIHLSVHQWRGQHPTVITQGGLTPTMTTVLLVNMCSFTITLVVLIRLEINLEKTRDANGARRLHCDCK